jgi:hypothetical protein
MAHRMQDPGGAGCQTLDMAHPRTKPLGNPRKQLSLAPFAGEVVAVFVHDIFPADPRAYARGWAEGRLRPA